MGDWTLLIESAKNIRLSDQEHRCGVGQKPSDMRISILVGRKQRKSLCVVVSVIIKSELPSQWKCIYTCLGCCLELLVRVKITKIPVIARSLNHNHLAGLDRHAREFVVIYYCFV